MFRVCLSDGERAQLHRRTHELGISALVRDRLELVRLSDAGSSVPQIASHLGAHEQTFRRDVKMYRVQGFEGLALRPHPGRPPRTQLAEPGAVELLLDETDRTWTAPQLIA